MVLLTSFYSHKLAELPGRNLVVNYKD